MQRGTTTHGLVLVGDADEPSCEIVGRLIVRLGYATEAFDSGGALLVAARLATPQLVILDSDLTGPTAYEVCRELREEFGESLPIVFVSATRTEPRDQIAGILLGADDYFIKPLDADHLAARLRRLLARSTGPARATLTRREREVLELLVDGLRPTEIADRLYISRKTASSHIEHIKSKLGAHSQAQAVAFAIRDNIIGSGASSAK